VTLQPRPYQTNGVSAVEQAWDRGVRRPAVVWATGLGKTVLFSLIVRRFLERDPERRIVILAHRTELIDQAQSKLLDVAPELASSVGLVKAERNQTLKRIILSSPQTLKTLNRRRQLLNVGLVIADESHHYAAPSYREVLEHFLDQDPACVALGVTATMTRGDRRSLGAVWQEIVDELGIDFGIANGYLVRPRGERIRVDDLDLRAVRRRGGDYDRDDLGDALSASMAPKLIAEALVERSPDDRAVVFAPNIASSEVIAEECRTAGLETASIDYKTPAGRRRDILEAHADEQSPLQVVTNAMVLTEGWDNPLCKTAVLARKTTNNGLYIQMVGRVLRPCFGKTSALVLDVCGATETNTLQAQIDLFGDDADDDTIEREPCACGGRRLSLEPLLCSCRRNGCTEDCACGGGRRPGSKFRVSCGCVWPEREVLEADDPVYADGRLVTEQVDLFHGSKVQWLTTAGGTHFLPAGERYIAIVPGEIVHTWDVVAMHRYRAGDPAETRYVQRGVHDLGFAQAWAEADVRPGEGSSALRDRSWRMNEPSEVQWKRAESLGIRRAALGPVSRGELNNMITQAEATVRIDFRVAYLRAGQRHG
jgi:superfamily II DNA or RNA helicase